MTAKRVDVSKNAKKGKAKKAAESDVGGEREGVWKLKTRWAGTGWGWQ